MLARAEHSLETMARYTHEQGKHIAYGVTHKGLLRYVLARYLGALDPEGAARAVDAGVDKHPHWNIRIRNAETVCVLVYRNRVILPDRGDGLGPAYPLHYRKLAEAGCRK